jgi:cell division protein FtsB
MDIHHNITTAHNVLLQIEQDHAYSTRLKEKKIAEQRQYIEQLEAERDAGNRRIYELEEENTHLVHANNTLTNRCAYYYAKVPKCGQCGSLEHNSRWHWRYN